MAADYLNVDNLIRGLNARRTAISAALGRNVGGVTGELNASVRANIQTLVAQGTPYEEVVDQISRGDLDYLSATGSLSGLLHIEDLTPFYDQPFVLNYSSPESLYNRPSPADRVTDLTPAPAAAGGKASDVLAPGVQAPPFEDRPELKITPPDKGVPTPAGDTTPEDLLPGGTQPYETPAQIVLKGEDRLGESPLSYAFETNLAEDIAAGVPQVPELPLPESAAVDETFQDARNALMGLKTGEGRGIVAEAARFANQRMKDQVGLTAEQQAREAERIMRPYERAAELSRQYIRNAAIAAGTFEGTGTVPGMVNLETQLAQTRGDVLVNLEVQQRAQNEEIMQSRIAQAANLGLDLQGIDLQVFNASMDLAKLASAQEAQDRTATVAVYGLREDIRKAMVDEHTALYQIAGNYLIEVFNRDLDRQVAQGDLTLRERQLAEDAREFDNELLFRGYALQSGYEEQEITRAWDAWQASLDRVMTATESAIDRQLQLMLATAEITMEEMKLAEQARQFDNELDFRVAATAAGFDDAAIARAWEASENAKNRALTRETEAEEIAVRREELAATVRAGDLDRAIDELIANGQLDIADRELTLRATEFRSQQDFTREMTRLGYDQDAITRAWQSSESLLQRGHELTLQQNEINQRVADRELASKVQLGTLDLETKRLALQATQFDSRLKWDKEAFKLGLDEADTDRAWREGQAALDRGLRREELAQVMTIAEADRQLQRETYFADLNLRTFQAAVDNNIRTGQLTLAQAQLVEQAREFDSNQDFQEWAVNRGITADEANRAWQTSERIATEQFKADQAVQDRSLTRDIEEGRISQADRALVESARQFDTRQEFENSVQAQDVLDREADRALTREVEEGRISQADRALVEQARQFDTRQDFDRWAVQQNLGAAQAERIWQSSERVQQNAWVAGQTVIQNAWEANERALDRAQEANLESERNQLQSRGQDIQLQIATAQITSAEDMQAAHLEWQEIQNELDRNLESERMAHQERLQNAGFTQEQALQTSQQTWQTAENAATRGANWIESEAARTFERQMMEAGYSHEDAVQLSQQMWQAQQNAVQNQHELTLATSQQTYALALQDAGFLFEDAQNRAADAHDANMQALRTADTQTIMARQQQYATELENLGFTHADALQEAQQTFAAGQAELDRQHENDLEASRQMAQLSQASLDRALQREIDAGRITQADAALTEQARQFNASQESATSQADLDRKLTREVEAGRITQADKDRIESARQVDARNAFDIWATTQGYSEAQRQRAWENQQRVAQNAWEAEQGSLNRAEQTRLFNINAGFTERQVAVAENAAQDQHKVLFGYAARDPATGDPMWVRGQIQNAALTAEQIKESIRIANDETYGYERPDGYVPGRLQMTAEQFKSAMDTAIVHRRAIAAEGTRADRALYGVWNPTTRQFEGGSLNLSTAQIQNLQAEQQRMYDALYGWTDEDEVDHMGSIAIQAGNFEEEKRITQQAMDAFYGYKDHFTDEFVPGRSQLDEQQAQLARDAHQRAIDQFYGYNVTSADGTQTHILGIGEIAAQDAQLQQDMFRGYQITRPDGSTQFVRGTAEIADAAAVQAAAESDARVQNMADSLQLSQDEFDFVKQQFFGGIGPDGQPFSGTADLQRVNQYLVLLSLPGIMDDPTLAGAREAALMGIVSEAGLDADILSPEEIDAAIADATASGIAKAQSLHSARATRDTLEVGSDEWWTAESDVYALELQLGFVHDTDLNALTVGLPGEEEPVITQEQSIIETYRTVALANGFDTENWGTELRRRHPEWLEGSGAPTTTEIRAAALQDFAPERAQPTNPATGERGVPPDTAGREDGESRPAGDGGWWIWNNERWVWARRAT